MGRCICVVYWCCFMPAAIKHRVFGLVCLFCSILLSAGHWVWGLGFAIVVACLG